MAEILWHWGHSSNTSSARLCLRVDTAGTVTTSLGGSVSLDPANNYGIGAIELSGVFHGQEITITHSDGTAETGKVVTMPKDGEEYNIGLLSCVSRSASDTIVIYNLVRRYNIRYCWLMGDTPYADGDTKPRFQTTATAGGYTDEDGTGGRVLYDEGYAAMWRTPSFKELGHNCIIYQVPSDHEAGNDWCHTLAQEQPRRPAMSTQAQCDAVWNNARLAYDGWTNHNPANTDSEKQPWKPSSADANTPLSNYPGEYFRVRIGDIEFFGMDILSHRCDFDKAETGTLIENDAAAKTQLGRPQITWLKNRLASSTATFKMIMLGQSTYAGNKGSDNRDFTSYLDERDYLLSWISSNISGVGFVGGDTHTLHVIDNGSHFNMSIAAAGQCELDGTSSVNLGSGYTEGYVWKDKGYAGAPLEGHRRGCGIIEVRNDGLNWVVICDYGAEIFRMKQKPGENTLSKI